MKAKSMPVQSIALSPSISEVWNGRLAMLGFIGIVVELISGRGP
jgi:hypothetical protein